MLIGTLLRTYRVIHEKSQKEIAFKIGIGPAVLCRLEANKPINSSDLLKVINYVFTTPSKEKTK